MRRGLDLEPDNGLAAVASPPAPQGGQGRHQLKSPAALLITPGPAGLGTPGPPWSVTSTRTSPSPARTVIVTVPPGAPERLCRTLLLKSSLAIKTAASRPG